MSHLDGRDEEYRVRLDSTQQARRRRVFDHAGRDEDRDRVSTERSIRERNQEPRYDPTDIAEDEKPGNGNRSTTRHDRPNDQGSRGYELETTSARRPSVQTTPSSNRLPTISRTSMASVPQLSNFTSVLSSLDISFISIPVDAYDKCRRFVNANPEVLERDPNTYLREAAAAHRVGKVQYARSCIQQALILRELEGKSPRRRQHFFDLMEDEDPDVLGDFIDDFDKAFTAVRRSAPTTGVSTAQRNTGTVSATYSQPASGAPRRTHEGNLTQAMSGMTVEDPPGRPRHNPSSHPQGDTTARGQFDSGGRRHQTSDPRRPAQTSGSAPMWRRGTSIRKTPGDQEEFDPSYSKRRDAHKFFRVGRVFALLWHEPAGDDRGSATGFRGENVYSSIRRMAVVRDDIHGACWAIPVHTYGNKGVAKRGFNQTDIQGHAILYMTGTEPTLGADEPEMSKIPIQVDPAQDQELHHMSRINFIKVHTVEHEVKVLNIGIVSKKSIDDFLRYWNEQRPK